jgi:protein-L-isoaspartate(D-aspartate) O-methyltransferase
MSEGGPDSQREAMVRSLIDECILFTPSVIKAMRIVPREKFVTEELRRYAYFDTPLPIGYGQTISAPHMVAIMTEALELSEGLKVLEVGAGSGYHAAVIAEVIAPPGCKKHGEIYSIEIIPELFEQARKNLGEAGYLDRVNLILGDGSLGYEKASPFDRILVTASAPKILESLVEQLSVPGILVMPVGAPAMPQELFKVIKERSGRVSSKRLGSVAFVPLVGKDGWRIASGGRHSP